MSMEWKCKIQLICSADEDGSEIYDMVDTFARLNNVIWDYDNYEASTVFVYEAEAHIVPRAKISKFVRHVCRWFAEAITEHAADDGERIACTTVEIRSRETIARNTFELTVSWRDHEYSIQQFIVPRSGDEAFYGWDADNKEQKGETK